jgi:hypothetical protein
MKQALLAALAAVTLVGATMSAPKLTANPTELSLNLSKRSVGVIMLTYTAAGDIESVQTGCFRSLVARISNEQPIKGTNFGQLKVSVRAHSAGRCDLTFAAGSLRVTVPVTVTE